MATNQRASRYLISTGLRLTDTADSNRYMEVIVCVGGTGKYDSPEIDTTFLAEPSGWHSGGKAYCWNCSKPHTIYSLADAFQQGCAPLSRAGDSSGMNVDTDDLLAAQFRWLQESQPRPMRVVQK